MCFDSYQQQFLIDICNRLLKKRESATLINELNTCIGLAVAPTSGAELDPPGTVAADDSEVPSCFCGMGCGRGLVETTS